MIVGREGVRGRKMVWAGGAEEKKGLPFFLLENEGRELERVGSGEGKRAREGVCV